MRNKAPSLVHQDIDERTHSHLYGPEASNETPEKAVGGIRASITRIASAVGVVTGVGLAVAATTLYPPVDAEAGQDADMTLEEWNAQTGKTRWKNSIPVTYVGIDKAGTKVAKLEQK